MSTFLDALTHKHSTSNNDTMTEKVFKGLFTLEHSFFLLWDQT